MVRSTNKQSGMVSILTLLFFMIFVSIIVVGFIRLMSYEQRQATDNDLSASALAAAQGGIEDGKRILLYCATAQPSGGKDTPECRHMLNSQNNCRALSDGGGVANMATLRNALSINMQDNDYVVGDTSGKFEQYYTCMTINDRTDELVKRLNRNNSSIIPLRFADPGDAKSLTIVWKSDDGAYGVTAPTTNLPPYSQWKANSTTAKPPVLRVQLIPYTSPINLDETQANMRTAFIIPSQQPQSSVNIMSLDQRGGAGQVRSNPSTPLVYANCTTSAGTGYTCRQKIDGLDAPNQSYYLKVTVLYGDSTIMNLTAQNASGGTVQFNGVQPEIDVTARANDVYRRIKARVSYGMPTVATPEYAVEANDICKNMSISDEANSWDDCYEKKIEVSTTPISGCVITGDNFVRNGDFSVLAGSGPWVDSQAGFYSELPNRGTDVYPDDSPTDPSGNPKYTGGFSIQTKPEATYYYDGRAFIYTKAFAGDPARGIPAAKNFFYSNPNQRVTDPKGTVKAFTGVLWGQDIKGLNPGQRYVFAAYFNNMLVPTEQGGSDPRIRLRVNGVDAGSPITVGLLPDEWMPISMTFTAPSDITPESTVKLEMFDDAHDINGDDFAMTSVSFYRCQ